MAYDGLEIDMLSVGRADCLLVTKWHNSRATRVLIDGGYAKNAVTVKAFLAERGVSWVDHLVCTHPDSDHAGGLVRLVEDEDLGFGKAWVHRPGEHVDLSRVDRTLSKMATKKRAEMVKKSLRTAQDLLAALDARGIPVEEPFEGKQVGFLEVCGPSEAYYEELVGRFADPHGVLLDSMAHVAAAIEASTVAKSSAPAGLEENPTGTAENDSSVILSTVQEDGTYLFTGDAGAEALERAKWWHPLEGVRWMQIPHHGGRSSITEDLIGHFSPSSAFVSADGSEKHPSPAVVDAFKEARARVFSTHHPHAGALRTTAGNVPDLQGYGSATAL